MQYLYSDSDSGAVSGRLFTQSPVAGLCVYGQPAYAQLSANMFKVCHVLLRRCLGVESTVGDAYAWLRAVRADQSHVGRVQRSRAYGSLRDALSPEPGPGGIAQAEDAVDSVDDKGCFLLWTIPGIRRNAMVCAVPGCTFVFTYRQAHPPSALPKHKCVDVFRPTLPERAATAAMQMVAEAGLTVMGRPHSGAGDGAVRLPQPLAVGWARKERRTIKQLHAEIKAQLCAMFDEGLLAAKVSAEAAVERLRAQRRSGALACADRDIPKVRQVRAFFSALSQQNKVARLAGPPPLWLKPPQPLLMTCSLVNTVEEAAVLQRSVRQLVIWVEETWALRWPVAGDLAQHSTHPAARGVYSRCIRWRCQAWRKGYD